MPPDMMISFHAMTATGFWNQIYKVGHALYLLRYFVPFMINCRDGVASPRIYSFLKATREHEGARLPVGTAGFCWGAKYVTELCWDQTKTDSGERLIDCGFIAHPSNLKYPSDIEKVVLPLSCAAAEIDFQMSTKRHSMASLCARMRTILRKLSEGRRLRRKQSHGLGGGSPGRRRRQPVVMLDIDVSNNNEVFYVCQTSRTEESRSIAVHLPTKSTHCCQMLVAMLKAVTCQRPH
jgi:hypothetical protein